jgi:hypothetical protein
MQMTHLVWRRMAAISVLLLAPACSDGGPAAPLIGTLRVSVHTSGGDLDVDGYEIVVDNVRRYSLFSPDPLRLTDVVEGVHSVAIEKVAPNCADVDRSPRLVTVVGGRATDVIFDVNCLATGITVTTRTLGNGPPSYQLLLNKTPSILVTANGVAAVGRLQPGAYTVALDVGAEHCRVVESAELSVYVQSRAMTPVGFDVDCGPPIRREKIAFVFDSTGPYPRSWVAVANPDGSGIRTIGRGTGPAWSPDGTLLAYSDADCLSFFYYGWPCTGGVLLFDPETRTAIKRLETGGGFEPAWAPEGNDIAFARCCTTIMTPYQLWIMSLIPSPPVQIPLPPGMPANNPAWSPDGQRLAFECNFGTSQDDVCIVNRNGTGFERLSPTSKPNFDPAWSPDGTRIAFTSDLSVAVMRLDDRTVTTLTRGWDPAWSPDGTKLVFTGDDGLYTVDADGSNRTRITRGAHYAPVWRP